MRHKRQIALFLILLVLSTMLVGAERGSQNSVAISPPQGYLNAPDIYVTGTSGIKVNVCSAMSGRCSAECGKLKSSIDLYKIASADPMATYSEAELLALITSGPTANRVLVASKQESYVDGTNCFNLDVSEQGYYEFEIGAFGSPNLGGVSNSFGTGFFRVRSDGSMVCLFDHAAGNNLADRHEFLCNTDGTYKLCNKDATGYEVINKCKEDCNADPVCEGFTPDPNCFNSCMADDGSKIKISGDDEEGTTLTITRPSGSVIVVMLESGRIVAVTVDGKKVNSYEDEPLIYQLKYYNIRNYDAGISNNAIEEHPSVDMIENGIKISDFIVGENKNRVLYSTLQAIYQKIVVNGGVAGSKGFLSFYMIAADGTRINVNDESFSFDRNGNAVIEDKFYPLVPDGVYKFLAEVYQGEEKRAYSYWMGERPDEGIIKIMMKPDEFVADLERAIPTSEALDRLFHEYLKVRQTYGIDSPEARVAFRSFMLEYLKKLYPNQEDYNRAIALLDDSFISETMKKFEGTFRDERFDFYFDQAIVAAETIKYILNERRGIADKGLLNSDWKNLIDPASQAEIASRQVTGSSQLTTDRLDFRIKQMDQIEGVFILGKLSTDYGSAYTVVSNPSTSDDKIAKAFGQQQLESSQSEMIRRPFTDYVLTRDLLGDIAGDNSSAVLYGLGWMFFYSGLRGYDADPAAFSDYPLMLSNGVSATKDSFGGIAKEDHDKLSKAQTTDEFTSPEEDMIMVRGLYEYATNTFINVTETYPGTRYSAMADTRLSEIKGIIFRQNLTRFFKMLLSTIISLIIGAGIMGIVSNLLERVTAAVVSVVSAVMKGAFIVTAGMQAVNIVLQCPKYLFAGPQSRAQEIMSAGEALPNCVAPLIDFALFTVAPMMIDKISTKGMMGDDPYQSKVFDEKVEDTFGKPSEGVTEDGQFYRPTERPPKYTPPEEPIPNVENMADAVSGVRDSLLKSIDEIIMSENIPLREKYVKLSEIAARGTDADELVRGAMVDKWGQTPEEADNILRMFKPKQNVEEPDNSWKAAADEGKQQVGEEAKAAENPKPKSPVPDVQNPQPIGPDELEVIRAWGGAGSSSEKLAQLGWRRQMDVEGKPQKWLYNPKYFEKINAGYQPEDIEFSTNGKTYKLHISASAEDFDNIVWEMGNYLDQRGIVAKVAPGRAISSDPNIVGSQYGKVFTVYAQNEGEMLDVVHEAERLHAMGLKGIAQVELPAGANLNYELPIQGTDNMVYYTIEKVADIMNGKAIGKGWCCTPNGVGGYPARIEMLKYYRGEGPLDDIAIWP